MATQQTFDFNRAARLQWLHALPLSTRSPLKSVLRELESYLGDNSTCWPSIRELGSRIGSSDKTVRRALHELQRLGYITIEPRARANGSHTSNQYAIVWLRVLDDSRPHSIESESSTISGEFRHIPAAAPPPSLVVPPSQPGSPPLPTWEAPPPSLGVPPSQPGRALNHPLNHSGNHPKKNHGNHGDGPRGKNGQRNNWWGRSTKITRDDLRDPHTIQELYEHACAAGWLTDAPAQRLRFHALCRYCARLANNPGAMLTSNVLADRWHASEEDERSARDGIKRLHAVAEPPAAAPPATPAERRRRFEMPRELFRMPAGVTSSLGEE